MGTTLDMWEKQTGEMAISCCHAVLQRCSAAAPCPALPCRAGQCSPTEWRSCGRWWSRSCPGPRCPPAACTEHAPAVPKSLTPELPSIATETPRPPPSRADGLGSKIVPVVLPPLGTTNCCHNLWADTEAASIGDTQMPNQHHTQKGTGTQKCQQHAAAAHSLHRGGPTAPAESLEQPERPRLLMVTRDPHRGNPSHCPTASPQEEAFTTLLVPAPSQLLLDTTPTYDPVSFWTAVIQMVVAGGDIKGLTKLLCPCLCYHHRASSRGLRQLQYSQFCEVTGVHLIDMYLLIGKFSPSYANWLLNMDGGLLWFHIWFNF